MRHPTIIERVNAIHAFVQLTSFSVAKGYRTIEWCSYMHMDVDEGRRTRYGKRNVSQDPSMPIACRRLKKVKHVSVIHSG